MNLGILVGSCFSAKCCDFMQTWISAFRNVDLTTILDYITSYSLFCVILRAFAAVKWSFNHPSLCSSTFSFNRNSQTQIKYNRRFTRWNLIKARVFKFVLLNAILLLQGSLRHPRWFNFNRDLWAVYPYIGRFVSVGSHLDVSYSMFGHLVLCRSVKIKSSDLPNLKA